MKKVAYIERIEHKNLEKAESILSEAEKIGLGDEENLQGVKSLLLFFKNQQVSDEAIKLAEKAAYGGNAIILKRIFKFILK